MAFKNLRAEMAREGISQNDVAEVVEMSPRTIWSWLNDETARVDINDAFAVRDAFFPSLTLEYLFAN